MSLLSYVPGPQLGHAPGPASCRESYLVLESLLDAARDALEVKTDDVLLDRALDVLDHKALAVDVLSSSSARMSSTCRLTSSPVIHLRQRSVLIALTSSV